MTKIIVSQTLIVWQIAVINIFHHIQKQFFNLQYNVHIIDYTVRVLYIIQKIFSQLCRLVVHNGCNSNYFCILGSSSSGSRSIWLGVGVTTPVSSVATYFGDGAGDGVWCGEDPECLLPVKVLLLLGLCRLPGHHDDERGELNVKKVKGGLP